jgi:hypothetical protein
LPVPLWLSLIVPVALANVPLEAVVAAVGVEINPTERPRELRGAGGFGLRAIGILRCAVAVEM